MIALKMLAYILPLFIFCAVACGQSGSAGESAINAVIDTVQTDAGSDFVVEKTEGIDPRYEPLIDRLVGDGFDETFVRDLFQDESTVFIPKLALVKPRRKLNTSDWYTWVNTDESSRACIDFLGTYDSLLTAVEDKYDVDKETIAALLRCETRHGTVTGDYHVLSAYASMALMSADWAIQKSWDNAETVMAEQGKSSGDISREKSWIKRRTAKRGGWAYRELKNVLKIHRSGTLDVRGLYGSWAGAFGWAQFIPSSYRRLAVDGDGDGIIDLYNPPDVIHSVAHYLSRGGYRSGRAGAMKKALRSYNPSSDYVNSIYGLTVRVQSDIDEE